MYRFEYRPQFLRDIKRLKRKHYDMRKLYTVIDNLEKYNIELLKGTIMTTPCKGI